MILLYSSTNTTCNHTFQSPNWPQRPGKAQGHPLYQPIKNPDFLEPQDCPSCISPQLVPSGSTFRANLESRQYAAQATMVSLRYGGEKEPHPTYSLEAYAMQAVRKVLCCKDGLRDSSIAWRDQITESMFHPFVVHPSLAERDKVK